MFEEKGVSVVESVSSLNNGSELGKKFESLVIVIGNDDGKELGVTIGKTLGGALRNAVGTELGWLLGCILGNAVGIELDWPAICALGIAVRAWLQLSHVKGHNSFPLLLQILLNQAVRFGFCLTLDNLLQVNSHVWPGTLVKLKIEFISLMQ